MAETTAAGSISFRQRAVLVTAAVAALGDSYCSMAWGKKLAEASSPGLAAAVIDGGSEGLRDDEKALADWARLLARDPNPSRTTTWRAYERPDSKTARSSQLRRLSRCGWHSPQ